MGLEYDNSAFLYFLISLLTFFILPTGYFCAKRIWTRFLFPDNSLTTGGVRSEKELKKLRKLEEEKSKFKNVFNWQFLVILLLLAAAIALLVYAVILVADNSQIKTFDPFEILGITAAASDREIKRAYRKQSLMYHPDKNPGDTVAEKQFMLIAKAYEALTNEEAKANYEKYGNPDGPQALQLSIGLPTFLLKSENHTAIMLMYLMILVVVIPSIVALWYSRSSKFGDSMILYDSYGFYFQALSENAHIKMIPEIFAGSAEFRDIVPLRASDEEELKKLKKQLDENPTVGKLRYRHPKMVKCTILIYAHLLQLDLSPALRSDLNKMLKISPHLLEAMLEVSRIKGWLMTTMNIIDFGQFLTQGLWIKDRTLMQLPHFDEDAAKHAATGKNGARSLGQYIELKEEDRKGMAKMTPEQREEVNSVIKKLPLLDVKTDVFVDDEEEMLAGDILTIKITMTRQNIPEPKEGEEDDAVCDLVYAPHFPFPKKEKWYVITGMSAKNRMQSFVTSDSQERVVTEKIMMQAPDEPGSYRTELYIKSDSYLGLDSKYIVQFTVGDRSKAPKYELHPEDKELDNDITMYDLMQGKSLGDSSDDEDSDDEDADERAKEEESLRRRKGSAGSANKPEDKSESKKDQ